MVSISVSTSSSVIAVELKRKLALVDGAGRSVEREGRGYCVGAFRSRCR